MRVFSGPTTLFHEWQVGNCLDEAKLQGPGLLKALMYGICLMIEDIVALSQGPDEIWKCDRKSVESGDSSATFGDTLSPGTTSWKFTKFATFIFLLV